MRVVSISHFPAYGGPHNQTLRLQQPLHECGIESTVILPKGSGADRLRAAGVYVEQLELTRVRMVRDWRVHLSWAAKFPVDVFRLTRLLRKLNPDVVQLTSLVNLQGAVAARLLGIPIVWQLVDTFPPLKVRRLMMYPIRWLSDVVMPIGYRVAAQHPGAEKFGERVVVFYPPVDMNLFQPGLIGQPGLREELGFSPEDTVVGVVGNVNPQKGHEYFIKAAATVLKDVSNAKFVIVGHIYPNHHKYYESLLALAEEEGLTLNTNLFFLGSREDIPQIMASLDILALASVPNSEGTPTVILEAMASGVPVVATDVGSVREVIANGVTGFIVPPLDSALMASRLIELIYNANQRRRFSVAARTRTEQKFSIETCVQSHVRAFEYAAMHRQKKSLRAHLLPRAVNDDR